MSTIPYHTVNDRGERIVVENGVTYAVPRGRGGWDRRRRVRLPVPLDDADRCEAPFAALVRAVAETPDAEPLTPEILADARALYAEYLARLRLLDVGTGEIAPTPRAERGDSEAAKAAIHEYSLSIQARQAEKQRQGIQW
jgi:hypothetical protein